MKGVYKVVWSNVVAPLILIGHVYHIQCSLIIHIFGEHKVSLIYQIFLFIRIPFLYQLIVVPEQRFEISENLS